MKHIVCAAIVLASTLSLGGCGTLNAWTSATLTQGESDAGGAAQNVARINADAVRVWKLESCGLTLGGLAAAADPVATKAAIQTCPPPNVIVVSGTDGSSVQIMTPVAQPIAAPAATPLKASP